MRKIVIKIEDDVTDEQAIQLVSEVIKMGQVSVAANNQPHYCFVTTFKNFVVSVAPKYWSKNETFHVSKEVKI